MGAPEYHPSPSHTPPLANSSWSSIARKNSSLIGKFTFSVIFVFFIYLDMRPRLKYFYVFVLVFAFLCFILRERETM